MSGTAEMKRIFAPLAKARTWSESLHLLLDLPLGIAWFTIVVTGLSLGVGLVPLALIGLVVLVGTVFAGRLIGIVERARAKPCSASTFRRRFRRTSVRSRAAGSA